MPVGDPVDEVEEDEDGWGQPHGPRVNVVCQRLLVRAQPVVLPTNRQLVQSSTIRHTDS